MSKNKLTDEMLDMISSVMMCTEVCPGVRNDASTGVVPRGLWPEKPDVSLNEVNLLIIGLNPGKARPCEKEYYKGKDVRNSDVIQGGYELWWKKIRESRTFYGPVRDLLRQATIDDRQKIWDDSTGVLWGNIVFCESVNGVLPCCTIAKCILRYLTSVANRLEHLFRVVIFGQTAYQNFKHCVRGVHDRTRKVEVYHLPHPSHGNLAKHVSKVSGAVKLNRESDGDRDSMRFFLLKPPVKGQQRIRKDMR